MTDIAALTRDYLDPIGVWVGLIAAVPIFWTWYDLVWGRRRRHKRWLDTALSTQGSLSAVLVVDLLAGKDITAAIRHFMAGTEQLQAIPDDRIVKVVRNVQLTPDDMHGLARDIQDAVAEVLRHGIDELHVFLAGPGCASAMVGAELSNVSCRVLLYQTGPGNHTYVNFGPLRHPRF